jgi:radical SAM superfamily enzyme YgiQ (UPF0313 family)
MKIWLADLTHTQQTIASDVIPAGIGMIAEYVAANVPEVSDIRLFKFPEDLSEAFAKDQPNIMGFSHYCWNAALSMAFARQIKEDFPEIVNIVGGPHFPDDVVEQEVILRDNPWIDYYVSREAEFAFVALVQALIGVDCDKDRLPSNLPNLSFIDGQGRMRDSCKVERVLDLTIIPSPYLSGRLDEFFDGRLLPVIQTARGCPFACTFCTEGLGYWNKVRHKTADVTRSEVFHIAEHLATLPEDKRRTDLLIADSNFGMFKQDIETCEVIAEVQDRYDYPKYINVATGKNKKERVLEAARLVRGAMKFAGSVQSLDPDVQENIKRKNISSDQIIDMAMKSSELGANTYSEVILGLPGDTLEAHFRTLETLVDAGFNTISMYTLMMLTGTEMGAEAVRRKFDMTVKYRVIPRCFGSYEFNGKTLNTAEIEEVCVANNTMPFDDYLSCRKMNFIINLFYNDGVFGEVVKLLINADLSPWGWFRTIYESGDDSEFQELLSLFADETENELWDSKDGLRASIQEQGTIARYVSGELGSNLIFKYKALSLARYFSAVCRVARSSIKIFLQMNNVADHNLTDLAEEIIEYKRMQVEDLFDTTGQLRISEFRFDVPRFADADTLEDLAAFRFSEPRIIRFRQSDEQRNSIDSYVRIFGSDLTGLTRILSRVYLKQFFRQPVSEESVPSSSAKASMNGLGAAGPLC